MAFPQLPHDEWPLYLIYLDFTASLVSKKRYSKWQDIQDEYEDYTASLGMTVDRLVDFARGDWHYDPDECALLRWQLETFLAGDADVLKLSDLQSL
jgi:hypothetical protein